MSARRKTMQDCIDLIESELGWTKVGRAIVFIDKNYDMAWNKHMTTVMDQVHNKKYDYDADYRAEIASDHYAFIAKHIAIYKKESPEFNKAMDDLFSNLGWNDSGQTNSGTKGMENQGDAKEKENEQSTSGI